MVIADFSFDSLKNAVVHIDLFQPMTEIFERIKSFTYRLPRQHNGKKNDCTVHLYPVSYWQ